MIFVTRENIKIFFYSVIQLLILNCNYFFFYSPDSLLNILFTLGFNFTLVNSGELRG